MRAIWAGSITFGLVNIPVKVYSASVERTLEFDLLHRKDLSRIHYKKVCEKGHAVEQSDIVKGFKMPDGHYVVLDKEDFERANARKTHAIEIHSFATKEEINPIYYERPYYLEADDKSQRAYALLIQALRQTKKVAVATFVFRQQENLGVIVPHEKGLMLNQLRFHEELRANDTESVVAKVQKPELDMAVSLIDAQTKKFDASAYRDTYHRELMAMIKSKSKGHAVKAKGEAPKPTNVIDLMAALERSLKGKAKPHSKVRRRA